MINKLKLEDYIQGFKNKNTAVLAQAITLIESTHPEHQKLAKELLRNLIPLTNKSKRIGISGTPGVGKSTFIENFGFYLTEKKKSLAVLAIDPTSQITGGSILGDKTRMQKLAAHKDVFIRPSSSGDTLGGVANKTFEAMLLCDAFGFDYILIETVGVGQSEVSLANIVDFFILLMQPGAGDELQGIKRGILEVSDLVVVNKADGENKSLAKIAQHDYISSLSVLGEKRVWKPKVLLCSSIEKTGFDQILLEIENYYKQYFQVKHRDQNIKVWLKNFLISKFRHQILNDHNLDHKIDELIKEDKDLIEAREDLFKGYIND